MTNATAREIREVIISHIDGCQTCLSVETGREMTGHFPGADFPIQLNAVASVLSYPDGWIEYETEVEHTPPDDAPWDQKPDAPALCRIYARGVWQVLVVYEGEA